MRRSAKGRLRLPQRDNGTVESILARAMGQERRKRDTRAKSRDERATPGGCLIVFG